MNLGYLSQRLFNVPLALHPEKAEVIIAALADRLGVSSMVSLDGQQISLAAPQLGEPVDRSSRGGYSILEGMAVIDVQGTLVNRLGTLRPYSGMTGYDGIRQNFLTAMADPKVKGVVLHVDSPGGEVAGCFDLVDTIYGARGVKPIHAVLAENAFSAAYAIASAADTIAVPRTGGTGSIGVIVMHVDMSQVIAKAGAKVTLITYGDRKADGKAEIPLSKEAHASLQAKINMMGDLFVATVARNRNIAASTVRDTQAGIFLGAEGVDAGLADEVMSPDAAVLALLDQLA